MGAGSASRLGFIEEAGIRVFGKDHEAGPEGGSVVGIGSNIVEESVDGFHCVGGCSCLLQANGAEGNKELVVNCSGII